MLDRNLATAGWLVAALVACTQEATEPTESSEAALAGCRPTGKVGSDEWRASLKACIDAQATKNGGGTAGKDGTAKAEAKKGSSCTVSISCNGNDPCRCGSGPSAGQTCDGRNASGAEACAVKCRNCD